MTTGITFIFSRSCSGSRCRHGPASELNKASAAVTKKERLSEGEFLMFTPPKKMHSLLLSRWLDEAKKADRNPPTHTS